MALKIAFLIYEGVNELDFIGPKDVLYASKYLRKSDDELYTVAATLEPVRCFGGTRVLPDHDFGSAPPPDILVVPGTEDPSPAAGNPELLAWVVKASRSCIWTTSVCTGAAILVAAGPARGRRITSHWMALDFLRSLNQATVVDNARYVVDGNVATSAGISAGIDMALWLVGQLHSPQHAREVQHVLEYYPEPPYAEAA